MARKKKEDEFYTLLKQLAGQLKRSADIYAHIVDTFPAATAEVTEMKVIETDADKVVKEIMEKLYSSFITPIDREDLSNLTTAMDNVCDDLNKLAMRFDLFNVTELRPETPRLARLITLAVDEMQVMFEHLPDYQDDPQVMKSAIRISDIEDEGDDLYHTALYRLFHEDADDRTYTVWLRLFDRMEGVLDDCDHVANEVRNVVMKSA